MIRSLLFSVALILFSINAYATLPQGFFFFGDSLTDSGYQNNNPVVKQEGKTPLWTSPKGHTWAYYFLKDYKANAPKANTYLKPNNVDAATLYHPVPTYIIPNLDGNNFAAGGATTSGHGILNNSKYKSPSLVEQVDYFVHVYAEKHHTHIAQYEYLLWCGGNNLIKKLTIEVVIAHWLDKLHLGKIAAGLHLFDIKKIPPRFNNTENKLAKDIQTAVNTLQKAGAKKIVVVLLPDLGDTPLIDTLAKGLQKEGSSITTKELSTEMNDVTHKTNALIRARLANTNVVLVDVNQALSPLMSMKTPRHFHETMQQFGKEDDFLIVNNKGAACPPKAQALTCIPTVSNASRYLFEDLGHPTDQTHRLIGDYVYHQSELGFVR